jgi:hypothetical protein
MAKKFMFVCVGILAPAVAFSGTTSAGANPDCKIAVHIKAHPTSCTKHYPTFTSCSDIITTYPGLGDMDVIPVFYDLNEYTQVEFGLTFDEWCTMSWVRCKGDGAQGSIEDGPSGTRIWWTSCQRGWSVAPGFGWCNAFQPRLACPIPNPATGNLGVQDCAASPGPYTDQPVCVSCAGDGGLLGDDPCRPVETKETTWGQVKILFK